ncbi:MAG: LysR family transcriptional regulator [Thermodesulfobium sp.]
MTFESENIELEITPKFRNFDWEKAKTFYYVAKFGSFVNAGRFLNISQSALSRQVIYLEQHLGCPLFSRHSGGVKMTRKGEELFAIIETTFIGIKDFTRNTHARMSNGGKRKIRIGTTHALASFVFSDLILDYNKDHPDLVFELIGEDHSLDVILNDVDIAIRPLDIRIKGAEKKMSEVQYDYLLSAEKKLYASPEYLERYGEPKTIEDLRAHRVIAFSHPEEHPYGDINWILSLGMPKGEFHQPIFTSNSVESLINAAKKGIGIVSSYEEYSILRSACLKNILPNVKCEAIDSYFIYPNYLKEDQKISEIKKYFQQRLASKDTSSC